MNNHRTTARVFRLLLITGVVGVGSASIGWADEPSMPSTSAPDTQQPEGNPADIQERAVIRDREIFRKPGTTKTPVAPPPPSSASPTGPAPIVAPPGATFEPDAKYPWVVTVQSTLTCRGVLLDPRWILTAAHCVRTSGAPGNATITYVRTNPTNGATQTEKRTAGSGSGGVYIHPQYDPVRDHVNDIALIKVGQPFTITPFLQTVGLPQDLRRQGVVGTLANFSHNAMVPAGQVAIFRAPLPAYTPTMPPNYPTPNDTKIYITAMAANASLCEGDSGSGFVTVEYGRATVRGVASQGNTGNCMTPNGEAVFTDVFAFRGWIFQTMGMSNAALTGNTRIRWSGYAARGTMTVACFNPNNANLVGPLNVVGVEEGAQCEAGQTQTVMCALDKTQDSTKVFGPPVLTGMTMRTTANGASQAQSIPPSGSTASFFGLLPAGTSREFTCQIGSSVTSGVLGNLGGNMAVLSRGVEEDQSAEPIVEQPSPFDPAEGAKP